MSSGSILEAFQLDSKAAIVTGAARDLSQGIALGLAEAGADAACVDILPTIETKQTIERLGRYAIEVRADLAEKESVDTIPKATRKAFGKIDILFNNAGIIRRAPLTEFAEKDWDEVININQ